MNLHDLGIGPRLTLAFLSVALLTLASGVIGLVGFWQASTAAETLVENTEMIRTVQEIRVSVGPLLAPVGDFLLNGDPVAHERYGDTLDQVRTTIDAYQEAHQDHSHTAEHSRSAAAMIERTKGDIQQLERLGETLFATADNQQAMSRMAEMAVILEQVNEQLNELLVNAEEDIRSAHAVHTTSQYSAYAGLTVSAVLAVSLAVLLAIVFTRSIGQPLTRLADAADRIAGGDIATPIDVEGAGEIGQLANSFERMRLTIVHERGQVRLLAVLEERDRIGREMHDGLAQVLGYVNTKALAVREFLQHGKVDKADGQILELVSAAREAYTDAREMIVGLRMNEIRKRSFAALVEEYIERFKRQSGISVRLEILPTWDDTVLPEKAKIQSLRIVQEALTNVRKHSQANQVDITLKAERNSAQIVVKDNGCGFLLSRLLRPDFSRYGLRTMRERAQAVGGTLRIESAPGEGTRIVVSLPLDIEET